MSSQVMIETCQHLKKSIGLVYYTELPAAALTASEPVLYLSCIHYRISACLQLRMGYPQKLLPNKKENALERALKDAAFQ